MELEPPLAGNPQWQRECAASREFPSIFLVCQGYLSPDPHSQLSFTLHFTGVCQQFLVPGLLSPPPCTPRISHDPSSKASLRKFPGACCRHPPIVASFLQGSAPDAPVASFVSFCFFFLFLFFLFMACFHSYFSLTYWE